MKISAKKRKEILNVSKAADENAEYQHREKLHII